MITRPSDWLVCDKCGEWFSEEFEEGEVCSKCKNGKIYLVCAGCGWPVKKCKCGK
jgi:hypothetical protein